MIAGNTLKPAARACAISSTSLSIWIGRGVLGAIVLELKLLSRCNTVGHFRWLPVFAVLIPGCAQTFEMSSEKSFEANVLQLIYQPPGSIRTLSNASGWFLGEEWRSSNDTVTTSDAIYVVIFEGPDGKFTVEGFGKRSLAAQLWSKLKESQKVKITYREVYEIVWKAGDKERERVKESVYRGNQLLDAKPVSEVKTKDF